MDNKEAKKLSKKIEKILTEKYLFEINCEKTRRNILYDIRCFLEKEKLDWNTLNINPNYGSEKPSLTIQVDKYKFEF
ncbi:MAG: hypothetical protein WC466_03820 [Candidatus Izemoplasmatales bacterium]